MRLAGRLQKVTIGSLKAAGFEEFGWVFKSETPGGHALGPEHTQGAFVYRHASESLYFFYQLWLPKVHGSAKTDRKLALDRAMRSNFSRKEGGGSAEGAPVGSPLPERSTPRGRAAALRVAVCECARALAPGHGACRPFPQPMRLARLRVRG